MALPPTVIGPLSECSTGIQVQGQLPNSHIRILVNGHLVAEGSANGGSDIFPLLPGQKLNGGDGVVATQDDSIESSPPVYVQKTPPALGPVTFLSHQFSCGGCVHIGGTVPGAIVRVGSNVGGNFVEHGSAGPLIYGHGRVDLVGYVIHTAEALVARQEACGLVGVETHDAPADNPKAQFGTNLPQPVIVGPLKECQSIIQVENIAPGSYVTLQKSDGQLVAQRFSFSTGAFNVGHAWLVAGQTVTAKQSYDNCEGGPLPGVSTSVSVQALDRLPAPVLGGPLCEGATQLNVSNLWPPAMLHIFSNGQEVGPAFADTDSLWVTVPTLDAGAKITVRQEACGQVSDPSNEITVDPLPAGLPQPQIPSNLTECDGIVTVANVQPGESVIVFSEMLGGEIGRATVSNLPTWGPAIDVPVSPLLIEKDHIFARVGCGAPSQESNHVAVKKLGPVLGSPSFLNPFFEGWDYIETTNAPLSNQFIELYLQRTPSPDEWFTSGWVGNYAIIRLPRPFVVGEKVKARARHCTLISGFSDVFVVQAKPIAKFTANPTSGNVPLTVNFIDQSTWVIGRAWDFDGDGNDEVNGGPPNQSWTYKQKGDFVPRLSIDTPDHNPSWLVVHGPTIHVSEQPSPPPPQLAQLIVNNSYYEPDIILHPGDAFTVYCTYSNVGSVATGEFTIRIERDGGADSTEYRSTSLSPGQSLTMYWNQGGGLAQGDHYYYFYLDWYNEVKESNKPNPGYVGMIIY